MAEWATPAGGLNRGLQGGLQIGAQFGEMRDKREERKAEAARREVEAKRQARKDKLEMSDMVKKRLLEGASITDPQMRKLYFGQVFKFAEEQTQQKAPAWLAQLANSDPATFNAMIHAADKQGMTMLDIWAVAQDSLGAADAIHAFTQATQSDETRKTLSKTTTDFEPSKDATEGPDAALIASVRTRITDWKKGIANAHASGAGEAGIKALQSNLDTDEKYLMELLTRRTGARQTEAEKPINDAAYESINNDPGLRHLIASRQIYPSMPHGEYMEVMNKVRGAGTSPTSGGQNSAAGAATKPGASPTLLTPGNIDLTKRPTVKNPDGSVSTVSSKSFNLSGKEVLLPTISDDGKRLSDEDAIKLYRKSGKHLGIYSSPEAATAASKAISAAQDAQYGPKTPAGATDAMGQPMTPPTVRAMTQAPAGTVSALPGSAINLDSGRGLPLNDRETIKLREREQLYNSPAPVWAQQEYNISTMGEYMAGVASGKFPKVTAAQLAQRDAAARNTEEVYGKVLGAVLDSGKKANYTRAQRESMLAILERAGSTGAGLTPVREAVTNLIQIFIPKFNPAGMSELQMMKAFSTKMAIEDLQKVGGNDSDRDFMNAIKSNPNIYNNPEANINMLVYGIQIDKIAEHKAVVAASWADKYGSLSRPDPVTGKSFEATWSAWAAKPENGATQMLADNLGLKNIADVYKKFGVPYRGKK